MGVRGAHETVEGGTSNAPQKFKHAGSDQVKEEGKGKFEIGLLHAVKTYNEIPR